MIQSELPPNRGGNPDRSLFEVDITQEAVMSELYELDQRAQAVENSQLLPVDSVDAFQTMLTEHEDSRTFVVQHNERTQFMGYVCLGWSKPNSFWPVKAATLTFWKLSAWWLLLSLNARGSAANS